MPPKPKKVRETFNALGVTGGAPKFKQQLKSARKPTSWERKALKAEKLSQFDVSQTNPEAMSTQSRAPGRLASKDSKSARVVHKRPHTPPDCSSSSSSSSSVESSEDSSSSDDQVAPPPRSKKALSAVQSKPKKTKQEKIVSVTFEHFPVEDRDFHGISVRQLISLMLILLLTCLFISLTKVSGIVEKLFGRIRVSRWRSC
jgi:hypothetical protein